MVNTTAAVDTRCRTCLEQGAQHDIFQTSLLQMLHDCFAFKFIESDGLPRSMCEVCLHKLQDSHNFLNQVISSHNTLCGSLNIPLLCQPSVKCLTQISIVKTEELKHDLFTEVKITEIKPEHKDNDSVTFLKNEKNKSNIKKIKRTRNKKKVKDHTLKRNAAKKYNINKFEDDVFTQDNSDKSYLEVLETAQDLESEPMEYDGIELKSNFNDVQDLDAETKTSKLTCRYCFQRFTDSISIKDHYTYHNNEEESCSTCGKVIRSRNMILQHKKRHSKIPCEYCGEFLNMYYIRKHVKARHSDWKKQCSICNVILTSPEYFKIHVKGHGERPKYKCDICKKEVGSKASHRWHMRSHTNVRPYKCRFCEKTFVLSKTKKEHECIHTGARPYGCPLCDKTFIQKSNLKGHFVHIHKEYNYSDYSSKIIFKSISKV